MCCCRVSGGVQAGTSGICSKRMQATKKIDRKSEIAEPYGLHRRPNQLSRPAPPNCNPRSVPFVRKGLMVQVPTAPEGGLARALEHDSSLPPLRH